ncbi:MAG TPA: hypothetical protein DHV26_00955 [Cytophagales bacterium]|nr:hypothetical protein [Cytophagales bacterium]
MRRLLTLLLFPALINGCSKDKGNDAPIVKADTLSTGWSKTNNIFLSNTNTFGGDLCFVNQLTGYASDNKNQVMKTVDGGITWSEIATGIEAVQMTVTPGNTLFLVSNDLDSIFRFSNGGVSLTRSSTFGNQAQDIFFSDNQTGICVTNANILLTRNGGESWTAIGNIPNISSLDIRMPGVTINGNNAWVVYDKYIYHSHDDFVTWTLDSVAPIVLNMGLLTVTAPSANTVYTSSFTGFTFKSTDGGNSFAFITTPRDVFVQNSFSDIQFLTDNTGYLSTGSRIFKTSNGGNTWEKVVAMGQTDIVEIYFVDPQHGWALCSDGSILRYNQP